MRQNGRPFDKIRPINIVPNYLKFAEGSAYIELGETKVITTVSVEEKVPAFLKGTGKSWISAEYSMLPRSTEKRNVRESTQGRVSGRTHEIQRMIGRSLRAVVDLNLLPEKTIFIDCDVIQADGGTRTASITASCVALGLAFQKMVEKNLIQQNPLKKLVAAISVGIIDGNKLLDMDYNEDSRAEIDLNVVQTETGEIVEIQGTGEVRPFTIEEIIDLTSLARKGLEEIFEIQRRILF
ncbi:MAG: ribonuclease PH [Acidobacteriota bacterium]